MEVVTTPAEVPVTPAPELDEMPVETEDSFVEDSLGPVPSEPEAEVTEEQAPETTPEPEAPKVAPEVPKEEALDTPQVETPEAPKVEEEKFSRLDRRVAQKYAENLVLKGAESPSAQAIEAELALMSVEEKKNALRNLLDENRSLRGQQPEALSHEDEEAIIEAEVERRHQIEQRKIAEREFQEDLVKTLAAHPELDNRTKFFNPKLEKAVAQIVESGVPASEAYSIVMEAVNTAKAEAKKYAELEAQKSMSGAVIAPPVSEVVTKTPETDEDKFIADALG